MSLIDPSTQLAAMIRAQFSAQFQAQAKNRANGTPDAARKEPAPPRAGNARNAGKDDEQIQEMVALRVRALSPDDPQRQRKAFRIFLESVLMQAFGRDRLDGPGFDQMVNAVLQRMESDPDLGAALREAGDLLLAETMPQSKRSPP